MASDIRHLDLNLLRVLDVLLDERNVTRAAHRLALTQPAVSGMLARLRSMFDDPLFTRGQRGLIPTARALALAAPLKQALAEVEQLLMPARFDPARSDATVRIAATDYAQQVYLVPLAERLAAEAPGLKLELRQVSPQGVGELLAGGEADLVLGRDDWGRPPLYSRRLAQEGFGCAMARRYAGRLPEDLDAFCALDHLLLSVAGGRPQSQLDEKLAGLGRRRNVVLTLPSFLLLLPMLQSRPLVAVAPLRLLRALQPELVLFPPPLPLDGFDMRLFWHGRTHRDPMLQWVRQVLVEVSEGQEHRGPG